MVAFSDKFIVRAKFVTVMDYLKHLEVMEFKKKKGEEERAKESQKTKEKVYDDYARDDLSENSTKRKQLRLPELNKYFKQHGLHQHIKSPKNDKVKVIAGHRLLQMNPEGPDALMMQPQLKERDGADKESFQDSDSDKDEYSRNESDNNDENDNDSINSGGEDDSTNVILAFIDDEEEVERSATTRSERSITRRSEIDFSSFRFSTFAYV